MIDDIRKIVATLIPFSVFCSIIYLNTYWSVFDFPFYQYITISDTISYAIPFFVWGAPLIVGVLISEAFLTSEDDLGSASSKKVFFSFVIWSVIMSILIAIMFWLKVGNVNYYGMFVICLILPSQTLSRHSSLQAIISHIKLRRLFSACIVIAPAGAFMFALSNAIPIQAKLNYKTIEITHKNKELANRYIFLGKAGDYFIVKSNDKEGYEIVKISENTYFRIFKDKSNP